MRQIVGTTAVVAFAVGSFASAGASTLNSSYDASAASLDLAAVVSPVAASDSEIEVTTETVENEIAYDSVEKDDSSEMKGTEKVVTAGVDGSEVVSYTVKTVDGVEVDRDESLRVLVDEPTDEVVAVGTRTAPVIPTTTMAGSTRTIGKSLAASIHGWSGDQWECLNALWTRESGWSASAHNSSSGAHGIPQALPGSKMATFGADWATNPATQIKWGLSYVKGRYGTPCGAWSAFQSKGWY
ncbi:G5 domain-containing protein [Demequina aurantiaca]|uniref:aggregation-promoting factor C-terminal-like domain-containing protein n=1 Tax=Demequina aurantiaca TaxID=676200 RepID=UPI003D354502